MLHISKINTKANSLVATLVLICLCLICMCISVPTYAAHDNSKVTSTLNSATLKSIQESKQISVDVEKSAKFDPVTVYLDGNKVPLTNRPFTYCDRVYLPIRELGTALGANIGWNDYYRVAIVEIGDSRVELPLGYRKAVTLKPSDPSSAKVVSIDAYSPNVCTLLYSGNTYLPIRFTAESLGFEVTYNSATSSVHFTTP